MASPILEGFVVVPYVRLFQAPLKDRSTVEYALRVLDDETYDPSTREQNLQLPFVRGSEAFERGARDPIDIYQVKARTAIELRFGLELAQLGANGGGQTEDLRAVAAFYHELTRPGLPASLIFDTEHKGILSNRLSQLVEFAGKEAVLHRDDFTVLQMERRRIIEFRGTRPEAIIETVFRPILTIPEDEGREFDDPTIQDGHGFKGVSDPTDPLPFRGAVVRIKLQREGYSKK